VDAAEDQPLQGGRSSRAALKLPGTFRAPKLGLMAPSNRNPHVH